MNFKKDIRVLMALALLTSLGLGNSQAASYTWDGNGNGNSLNKWSAKQNWGNTAAPGINDIAIFNTVASGNSIIPNVDAASSISGIVFANTATNFTINGAALLTIGSGGISNSASALQTFNTAIALGGAQVWTGSGNMNIAGIVSGSGALTKSGTGTVNLTGANTFSGGLTVGGGKMLVNNSTGSGTGTGNVVVNSGTFGGAGKITGGLTLNSGGRLAPGANGTSSIGTITTGNQTWNGGGALDIDMSNATGTAGTGWDSVAITGSLTLNATPGNKFNIALNGLSLANFDPNNNYQWNILQTTGGITGFDADAFDITTTGFGTLLGSSQFLISLVDGGNILAITYVPEPSTIALGLLGAALVTGASLRRKK